MSKMTQRRMARRASRKINEANRDNRKKARSIVALSSNLQQAFNAIRVQKNTIQELRAIKSQPAASTETL